MLLVFIQYGISKFDVAMNMILADIVFIQYGDSKFTEYIIEI